MVGPGSFGVFFRCWFKVYLSISRVGFRVYSGSVEGSAGLGLISVWLRVGLWLI